MERRPKSKETLENNAVNSGGQIKAMEGPALPSVAGLFEEHADGIFNFCRRFTGDEALAEDLTQEVFVRALRFGSRFEGRARPSTWLYAIASNLCKDSYAKNRRLSLVEDGTLVHLAGHQEALAPLRVEQGEVRRQVRGALSQLTENQREVILLSRYHGKTYPEISEITGQSVGAIKQTMFRAMNRLRKLLGPTGDES